MNITAVITFDEPAIKKPFMYHCTGLKAVREAHAPKGTTVKMQY
jgi:hypothetical protein